MRLLSFRHAMGTTSWNRAHPDNALIERIGDHSFVVTLKDGCSHHECRWKVGDENEYRGTCDCKGFQYNDGPCAHLCTLRKAYFIGATDNNGQPITPYPLERVVADGGKRDLDQDPQTHATDIEIEAAGSDGQTFGRPEGQL